MNAQRWKPARYFPGFVVVEFQGIASKWVFTGGIMIPVSHREAMIYEFDGGPFVQRVDQDLRGVVLEIQYAISIFDTKENGSVIAKYNHPFDLPVRIRPVGDRGGYSLRCKSRLFLSYPAPDVMPEAAGCPHKVVQFVA